MSASAKKLLLVDDEPDTLSVFGMLLEFSGYEVTIAQDGAEALRRAAEKRPEVVVTDWMMPGMNGRRLCAELRREGSTFASVPIIVASAAMLPPEGEQTLYDRFLRKPVLIEELIRAIEECLASAKRDVTHG